MSLSTRHHKASENSTLACEGPIGSCVYFHIIAMNWNYWLVHMARKPRQLPSIWSCGVVNGRLIRVLFSSRLG
ncbi:hypothetical protein B5X24_HaOG208780 [Helicoverpa armigera]|uniref:Uncharacterized protein n=1 Tax=Helicoverpa armigera TaxID=29058 RepID=A0A2W1BJD4_HELAM|nr:hypothetical protein B5X24_HaOG208780 [Helicoverpa armigera]